MQEPDDPSQNSMERRVGPDRRTLSAKTFLYSIFIARRHGPQRREEQDEFFYKDVYDAKLFLLILLIASLSVADAGLTLLILEKGGVEMNPFMDWTLEFSNHTFFIVKYLTTVFGLILVVIHVNFRLFKRISMPTILAGMLGVYALLVSYEFSILAT